MAINTPSGSVRPSPGPAVAPGRPADEADRLATLGAYSVLDSPAERDFDDIVALAAEVTGCPMAMVSLVDADRQWSKAALGFGKAELPRDDAFCAHAILDPDHVTVVHDTLADPRFQSNPLVVGEPFIRFYAGAPLVAPNGQPLGTLCVLDVVPRTLTTTQIDRLEALARQAVTQLELRRTLADETVRTAERLVAKELAADAPARRDAGESGRRALRARCALGTLAVGLTAAVLQLGHGSGAAKTIVDLAFIAGAGVASASCLVRAKRDEGESSRGWRWLGVAMAVWCAAAVAWAYFGITRDHVYPFPSISDIGFTGYAIPAVVGLWWLRAPESWRVSRLHAALDASVIGGAILFVSAVGLLTPLLSAPADGWLARAVSLAYPVVDVTMVAVVLALGMRQPAHARLGWALLAAGFTTLAITDSVYSYRVLAGTYESGHLLDVGWVAAFVIIAVAAGAPVRPHGGTDARLNVVQEMVPYVPLGVAVAVAGAERIADTGFALWVGVAVGVLAIIRQVVVVVEHVRLADDLERRVAARTADVDAHRRFLAAVVNNLDEGVVACDARGDVVLVNDAAQGLADGAMDDGGEAWLRHLLLAPPEDGGHRDDGAPMASALRGDIVRDVELVVRGDMTPERVSPSTRAPSWTPRAPLLVRWSPCGM